MSYDETKPAVPPSPAYRFHWECWCAIKMLERRLWWILIDKEDLK